MLTKYITVIAMLIYISSCTRSIETIVVRVPALRASSILMPDSVYNYLKKYGDTHKVVADYYLNKGKELQQTNLQKAIYYVKRSISLNPTKDKYIELIELMSQDTGVGQYSPGFSDIYRLYTLLIDTYSANLDGKTRKEAYLFGKPDKRIICDYLVFNAQYGGSIFGEPGFKEFITDSLHLSLSDLKKEVLSDRRLKFDTNSEAYKDIVIQFLSDAETEAYLEKPSTFLGFIKGIKDTSAVFEINKYSVQQFDYSDFNGQKNFGWWENGYVPITYLYARYVPEGKKNNDWRVPYNFEHVVWINDSIVALIYSVDFSVTACPKDMRDIHHEIVTYNKKGKIIANDMIAFQDGDGLATMKFNHGRYIVTNYKRYWEKPYDKSDFDNNIDRVEMQGEEGYQVKPDGTLEKLPVPAM
jgi:hypothetical protein